MVKVIRGDEIRDVPDSLYAYMLQLGYSPYLSSAPLFPVPIPEPDQGAFARYDQTTDKYLPTTVASVAAELVASAPFTARMRDFQRPDKGLANALGYHSQPVDRNRALRRFHSAARAAQRGGSVSILCGPSDSITDGLGASSFYTKWTSLFRDGLRRRLGLPEGGFGYTDLWNQAAHPDHPVVTNLPIVSQVWGLGRQSLTLQDVTPQVQTITITGRFTDLDLIILATTGGATGYFQVSVDGQAPFVVNTGAAVVSSGGAIHRNPALQNLAPDTVHTVVIAHQSGPYETIEGVFAYHRDQAAGVRVWEAGQSGQTAQFFDYTTSPYWWQSVTSTAADLVILPIGSNDYAQGRTLAAAKANIASIVDTLPAALGFSPSVVLVPYYDRAHGGTEGWSDWVQAYHEIASTRDNVCVFDLGPLFGPWTGDNRGGLTADTLGGQPDLVHPSDLGHQIIARGLLDWVLETIEPVTAPYQASTTDTRTAVANSNAIQEAWTPPAIPVGMLRKDRSFRISLAGDFDNVASSGAFQSYVYVNGVQVGILQVGSNQTNAATGTGWTLEADLMLEAIGAGGLLSLVGTIYGPTSAAGAYTPRVALNTGVAVDLSTGLQLSIRLRTVSANAGNIIRLRRAVITQVA